MCLTFWEIFKILFEGGSHFHSGSWNLTNDDRTGEPKVELRRGWSPHEHQVASDPQVFEEK